MDSLIIFYVFALALTVSILLIIYFPVLYAKEKQNVIAQIEDVREDEGEAVSYPLSLVLMLTFPVLVFYHTEEFALSIYCFVFAMLAYADLSARWLPDILLYVMLAISMYMVRDAALLNIVVPVILFVAPAVMLNVSAIMKRKQQPIANGDFYIFPSIGMTLQDEYAFAIMAISIFVSILVSKRIKKVPFVLILYIAYGGYLTCISLGL